MERRIFNNGGSYTISSLRRSNQWSVTRLMTLMEVRLHLWNEVTWIIPKELRGSFSWSSVSINLINQHYNLVYLMAKETFMGACKCKYGKTNMSCFNELLCIKLFKHIRSLFNAQSWCLTSLEDYFIFQLSSSISWRIRRGFLK